MVLACIYCGTALAIASSCLATNISAVGLGNFTIICTVSMVENSFYKIVRKVTQKSNYRRIPLVHHITYITRYEISQSVTWVDQIILHVEMSVSTSLFHTLRFLFSSASSIAMVSIDVTVFFKVLPLVQLHARYSDYLKKCKHWRHYLIIKHGISKFPLLVLLVFPKQKHPTASYPGVQHWVETLVTSVAIFNYMKSVNGWSRN